MILYGGGGKSLSPSISFKVGTSALILSTCTGRITAIDRHCDEPTASRTQRSRVKHAAHHCSDAIELDILDAVLLSSLAEQHSSLTSGMVKNIAGLAPLRHERGDALNRRLQLSKLERSQPL